MDQGIPLSPAVAVVSMMIDSVAKMRPSQQEKRGDQKLDKARELAEEYKPMISESDLDTIAGKISHARDMRDVLDSKSGIPKFLLARQYRKVARDAYQFTKHVSDRGRDAACFRKPLDPSLATANNNLNPVIKIAQRLYRCHLSCSNAFPSPSMKEKWINDAWSNACERTCGYPHTPPPAEELVVESIELFVDMKGQIMHLVQSRYGFSTKQSPEIMKTNTTLVHTLLTNMAFIHRDPTSSGTPQHPYQHPIIQETINRIWFPNSDGDGVFFHEHFTTITIKAIALALTLIESCISEWTSGIRQVSDWKESNYEVVYHSHIKSLSDLPGRSSPPGGVALAELQRDFSKNARKHAGVPSEH